MPSMNVDELAEKLFEPISVTINGNEYTITTMPSEAFDGMDPENMSINSARKALASMLSVTEKEFKKVDYRKITIAAGFIMEEATKQISAYRSKNVPGGDVDQKV